MWKLKRIYAENLLSFKELDYTIQQGITTLIFGQNNDNESQKSNGSGKSAFIEGMSIGITGSPLRKVKAEEIINDAAESMEVQLEFFNDFQDELFTVTRTISRKGPSSVFVSIVRNGQPVDTDETKKSSVDEYNSYILYKLGLSKDEIFNNFILSESRYQDFLSSSDKDKKDIINRFSNGNMVDIAIENLKKDAWPISEKKAAAEILVSRIEGNIEVLDQQIEKEKLLTEENKQKKEEKIRSIESDIASKRQFIREENSKITELESRVTALEGLDESIRTIDEVEGLSINQCIENVTAAFKKLSLDSKLTDWSNTIEEKKQKLSTLKAECAIIDSRSIALQEKLDSQTTKKDQIKKEVDELTKLNQEKILGIESEFERLNKEIEQINNDNSDIKRQGRVVSCSITDLKNKIVGTVKCPACSHEFLVSDKDFDVQQAKIDIDKLQNKFERLNKTVSQNNELLESKEDKAQSIRKEKSNLLNESLSIKQRINLIDVELNESSNEMKRIISNQKSNREEILTVSNEIDNLKTRVVQQALFVIDDEIDACERSIKSSKSNIVSASGSIEALQSTSEDIKNSSAENATEKLKASLKEYQVKYFQAKNELERIDSELKSYLEQEQIFIEFKTYLANTKIAALSQITNEFLENIGSDIRVRFSGYTTLKSGKVRDKISISLIRDGIDCGNFLKFSKGERARVNLANILAMAKLINVNSDAEKGLDILVLDEVLNGIDEDGLSNILGSLNDLGITSLVVSHGKTAESYPYTLTISKTNGESKIIA